MSAKAQAARLKQMLRVRKRRGVKEWKDQQKRIENMAIMIQKHVRRKLAEIHHEERDYAIEFIQAPVRGYLVRQDMARKKSAANRLQRVYRGAQVRLDLRRAARAMTLIQRIMRGKITRLRLKLQKLRRERVVHTFIAIDRLLARSTLLWDMGEWQQYRDSESNGVWYYNTKENDTRWKAPECFEGLFVCGFDDCQTKICKESFETQQELNNHRKTHNWECDSCWWKNGWADWPKCSMCANICTKHPINLNLELEKRRAYRKRKEMLAKQKERLDEKRRAERARRLESKRRADAQKRERRECRLMQQEDELYLSRHELPQDEEPVSKTQRNKIKLDDDEDKFDIMLAKASATEIVEALFTFAAEYHHVYPLKTGMAVHRYPDGSLYVGEMLDSAPHGQGEMVAVNGDRYKGEWENGKRHGVGELEMASGLRYDGPWKFGARHGWGKLVMPNGDIYEGEWDHGLLCGRGTMISADEDHGDVYEGNWKSSKFHGLGTYRKGNGDVYTGHFNMGVMHGKGIMVYKTKNCSYRGEFTHGERTGRGYWLDANGHQWMGTWYRGRLYGSGIFISKVTEKSQDASAVSRLVDVLTPAVEGQKESAPGRPESSGHHEHPLGAKAAAKLAAERKARGDTTFDVQVGEKYVGQFNNSQRRGKGEATYANGDVYKGDWFANLKHGFGVYDYHATKERYVGRWHGGQRHGRGKYFFNTGSIYDGQWQNDTFGGRGVFEFQNGDVYKGYFKNHKMSRTGTYVWKNGNMYTGQWAKGQMHGFGKMTYAFGHVYEGEWQHNCKHGKGTLTQIDGDVFVGEWKDDKRVHGKLEFNRLLKNEYVGDLDEETGITRDGFGKYTYGDGSFYEGEWKRGRRHGKGLFVSASGTTYKGEFVDDRRQGFGVLEGADKSRYAGYWHRGLRHGYGKEQDAEGACYQGEWRNDRKHGDGEAVSADGRTVYKGRFVRGERSGEAKLLLVPDRKKPKRRIRLKVFAF